MKPAAFALLLAPAALVSAQPSSVSFFYQNVPLVSRSNDLVEGGASDFNRFRFMFEPAWGKLDFELAYEQVATFRERRTPPGGLALGRVPGGGEWLDLQWTLADEEHALWQHRFDRLNLSFRPVDGLELSAGRQTVSWATTLFLTPSDPFSPFSPADPFRLYRAGVDAVRLRVYPGPLSEVDVVVRPTEHQGPGEELTLLGRGLTTLRGFELSAWGGSLYGDRALAFGVAGSVGSWAVRGEGVLRGVEGEAVFRATVGVDRRLELFERELYVVVELQHDGLGAEDAADYARVLASDPFARGELQVLGRLETVAQASLQFHPLVSVSFLGLVNLSDQSVLVAPSFSYSVSDDASLSGGVFAGFGESERTPGRPVPSEYGALPLTLYASLSYYF